MTEIVMVTVMISDRSIVIFIATIAKLAGTIRSPSRPLAVGAQSRRLTTS